MSSELQRTYNMLESLILWDPSIIAPRGTLKMRVVAREFGVKESEAETMISNLRNHLENYVDDTDFCNDINWCFPRAKYNHLGYEQ